MFISPEKLDLFARYVVATGYHIEVRNLINFYEERLARVKEENTIIGSDIESEQDAPMLCMGC